MRGFENNRLLGYHGNIENVVWPPISAGRQAALVALLHQLEQSQWFSSEKISRQQYAQLASLAEYAARHSPAFAKRLQLAGLQHHELATPQGLQRLPVLSRRDIQKAGSSLYCSVVPRSHLPVGEVKTSGSTGEPVVVRKSAISNLLWMAMTMRDHFWHGRDFSQRLLSIRANARNFGRHSTWGEPVNLLYPTAESNTVNITTDIKEQIRLIREFKPHNVIIYPSNLAGILAACQQQGQPITGVTHLRTIGETLTPALREHAAAYFQAKVEDVYSSQEMGNLALQCPESGQYHVMENIILEVLDDAGQPCAEGQIGRVVATDLLNLSTPLIRYDIMDYAQAGGACPCGRGLPTIRRIIGRERNLIVKPDGGRHWPLVGFDKFRDIAPISQYQLIQHDLETIEVRLVSEKPVTALQEEKLRAHIRAALGHPYTLNFTYFANRLPLRPNGKFEEFICLI